MNGKLTKWFGDGSVRQGCVLPQWWFDALIGGVLKRVKCWEKVLNFVKKRMGYGRYYTEEIVLEMSSMKKV